ncbi:hypothetical protein VDGE_30336 [Verticillium dahliae]|uniref:Uncharacterized protein n=1 Tax=Verticillium dahliae TaxID=27337 RepID=A0A444S0L7_VERDA|nr:hypothetical protein VDGE_30336 [Verticillium dahliae]
MYTGIEQALFSKRTSVLARYRPSAFGLRLRTSSYLLRPAVQAPCRQRPSVHFEPDRNPTAAFVPAAPPEAN